MKPLSFLKVFAALVLAGCSALGIGSTSTTNTAIKASGTITAVSIDVSPEMGGKVTTINFNQGDSVKVGDVLFQMDDQILQAQLTQANATASVAQANVDLANQRLANAQAQYNQVVQAAQMHTGQPD
jgi:multidrug efflux pump subunit AcrA (membrane-fusion protein)